MGGFKKLFLSKQSDVVFTDGTKVKDLNGPILAKEEEILQLKKGIIEKIEKDINIFITKVTNDIFNKINSKEKIKFIEYLSQKGKKVDNLFKLGKKNKKQLIYGKELKEYCNSLYNFDSIKEQFNLDNLEKEYSDLVQNLLIKIKDKNYEIGKNNFKSLSFLGDNFKDKKFENLDDLKNYFNDSGYKVIQKDVDLEKILKQVKAGELEIFQIKSKDMSFHKDFINDKNCGIIKEAKTEKSDGFKKDLNTLYFEEFFKDIENNNRNSRIGADFKIRGINSSENNDYESFWKKEKNQARHFAKKDKIANFQNRFKRDRYSIEFSINLNATNHLTEDDFNTKLSNKLKEKRETGSLRILSLDHGESSFLTYKIFEFSGENLEHIQIINTGGNFDNFQQEGNGTNRLQKNIQIDEKVVSYQDQKILDNYITKYHLMIQDQKRERQVEEAIKHFARKSISKIKEIISADTIDKNKEGVSDTTKENVKKFIQISIDKTGNKEKDSIASVLGKFYFDYNKYSFKKYFPDQENIKQKIDNYIGEIQELLDDENKLIAFCNAVKNSFDGKSLADLDKLYDTPFYAYINDFKLNLQQINNLKKGYVSALIGTISKWVMNGDIDIVALENNLLYYGIDNSKLFQKHMGAENHATFAEALINKLSFCFDKEKGVSYQFSYPIKVKDRKKLENKHNGILFFINQNSTSLLCPKCGKGLKRDKKNGEDHLYHNDKNPAGDACKENPFEIKKSENIVGEYQGMIFYDGDDLATFNIARKGVMMLKEGTEYTEKADLLIRDNE